MSGVYIKGMEMPTDCALLLKIFPDGRVGVPVHLNWAGTMVVNDAKAVPVPPHGRLIDADAMEKECCHGCKNEFHKYENCIDCVLANAPTIIPASFENPTKNARYSQDNPAEEGE